MKTSMVRTRIHVMKTMRDARGRWFGKCATCPVETDLHVSRKYLIKYGPADHARKHRLGIDATFME